MWQAAKPASNAVGSARRWVREQAAAWGVPDEAVETAELVTSELVTNAVNHARTAFGVTLRYEDDVVTISVFDGDTRLPTAMAADVDATGGRGLLLVQALSARWGTATEERDGIAGKVVWAEVSV